MKTVANSTIREAAKKSGVFLWQVAAAYGLNDSNFSRKLRTELPLQEREIILSIINKIAAENGRIL